MKLGVGRRRKRRKILVSDRLKSSSVQIQGMAPEVWSSIFCMGKLSLHWLSFLVCGAWESGLCSAEALMGYSLLICLKLQLSYFQAAAGGCKFLISSEAETA